jgi:hypothetical protein
MAALPKKGKGFLQVLPANMLIVRRSLPVFFVRLSLFNQELKLLPQAIRAVL